VTEAEVKVQMAEETMHTRDITLVEKRAEVKQLIDDRIVETFPAYWFDKAGKVLQGLFHLSQSPHWTLNALAWLLVTHAPGLLVAVILKETLYWGNGQWFYVSMMPLAYIAAVFCYVNVVYNLLPGIRNHIVDAILTIEDLDKLERWLEEFWSVHRWQIFTLVVGELLAIIVVVGASLRIGAYIGIGLTLASLSIGPFWMGAVYIIFQMLMFLPQVATYQLKIYDLDPANSEVIQRLNFTINTYLYILALYLALPTTLLSLNPIIKWIIWVAVLMGWIPTIMQFIISQYTVRKIIVNAKWIALNQIQQQIIDLQNKDLRTSPELATGQINALMDLHDRIRSRPNSTLNLGTGISFLNQLMLPVLGLLLGNLDKFLNLLKP
jgi:hypothetical protein